MLVGFFFFDLIRRLQNLDNHDCKTFFQYSGHEICIMIQYVHVTHRILYIQAEICFHNYLSKDCFIRFRLKRLTRLLSTHSVRKDSVLYSIFSVWTLIRFATKEIDMSFLIFRNTFGLLFSPASIHVSKCELSKPEKLIRSIFRKASSIIIHVNEARKFKFSIK